MEEEEVDYTNREFRYVFDVVTRTDQSVYMTGRAGSGKSTFLRHIVKACNKESVVLAPTGIAALNARGQTIHSFFKIPPRPYLPGDTTFDTPAKVKEMLKLSGEKIKLIGKLQLIVIDEVSMVRADLLDFVDVILRTYCNRRLPFGGKQMLFVGDAFQLEPVVKGDEWDILRRQYQTPYFWGAKAFSKVPLLQIELQKVYRQHDSGFLALLDRVRVGTFSQNDIFALNSRVGVAQRADTDFVITLCATRAAADGINECRMEDLKTDPVEYEAQVSGEFPDSIYPTMRALTLKEGAQVMFVRNDQDPLKRWCNGTLGRVTATGENSVTVLKDDGEEVTTEMVQWENVRYRYNEEKHKVEEETIGTFTQIPLRPAWAVTIHKSQGLTFNNVHIDLGRGAFACGQTYVALSRCTSIGGITLAAPVRPSDIRVSQEVVRFASTANDRRLIEDGLRAAEAKALWTDALDALRRTDTPRMVRSAMRAIALQPEVTQKEAAIRLITRRLRKIDRLEEEIRDLVEERRGRLEMARGFADEYLQLARMCTDDYSDDKAALKNLDKALALCPAHRDALVERAKIYISRDKRAKAVDDLKTALAYSPGDEAVIELLRQLNVKTD